MPTVSPAKRREVASMWFKQLLAGQEQQGTTKAAAAAWLGTIYALRASARLDGNKAWGRVGNDMIGLLEHAFLKNMGKDGQQQIEAGRRLLQIGDAQHLSEMPDVKVPKVKVSAKPLVKFKKFKPVLAPRRAKKRPAGKARAKR